MFEQNISFGDPDGVRQLYSRESGLGFLTAENRLKSEWIDWPEVNGGWEGPLTKITVDEDGCCADAKDVPLCFKADVPGFGNYRVTVTLKARTAADRVLIFAGRRHLAFMGQMSESESLRCTFTVNACDIIPYKTNRTYADHAVDLAVLGDGVRICELEIWQTNTPTIFIGGDSTVASQGSGYPYRPGLCHAGWGQMLGAYLGAKASVCSQAHCGLSTETFREGGHWDIVKRHLNAGDYLFLQFGHNDQKLPHLTPKSGYRDNLMHFLEIALNKGAYPLLVTPVARRYYNGPSCGFDLKDYAEACRRLGGELGIPVLDLFAVSSAWLRQADRPERWFYPNDGTHGNDYGAYLAAGFVAEELRRVCGALDGYQPLAETAGAAFGQFAPC